MSGVAVTERMSMTNDVRAALLSADPRLSRFNPLERIVMYDDFNRGLNGWVELIGNYLGSLDHWRDAWRVRDDVEAGDPVRAANLLLSDCRPPMLSSATMWDVGTHGALSGTYALKVATRPIAGHLAKALKRITWRRRGRLQCELYFTFHPEPSALDLGEGDVRTFGISYDIQDDEHRYWPAIRYLNAENGVPVRRWQYHAGGDRVVHLEGFEDVPGGSGNDELCYNEIATKQNWHYLRWLIDLETRQYVELECNDRVYDLRGTGHTPLSPYPNLRTLLNLGFWVEAGADRRCFLYVDSVLLSTDA
jgi:hypothetical protein